MARPQTPFGNQPFPPWKGRGSIARGANLWTGTNDATLLLPGAPEGRKKHDLFQALPPFYGCNSDRRIALERLLFQVFTPWLMTRAAPRRLGDGFRQRRADWPSRFERRPSTRDRS
jgi:hypothetical protein